MKVSCSKEFLEKAVLKAKEATEKKATLPILTNFLLEASDETLKVQATDLENYLSIKIPADIKEEGKVCINSQKLAVILKNTDCEEVILQTEGENVIIRCGKSKFKLTTFDVNDYPEFPKKENIEKKITFEGQLILEAIKRVDYAIPKDAENLILNGMCIKTAPSEVHFVGTDGHRLALFKPAYENTEEAQIVLPKKSLKVLKKLITDLEEIEIELTSNFAFISGENWELITRLLEGEYPDYESVIPSETPINVEVDKEKLIKAIKRVSSLLEGKIKPVSISLKENSLILRVSDPEFGEAEDLIEIAYQGEPLTVEFNSKFLIEALNNFKAPVVMLKLIDADSPMIIEPADIKNEPYICLIMPMTI